MPKPRGCCSITPVIGAIIVGVPLCVIALAFAPKEQSTPRPLTISPATFTPTPAPTAAAATPTGFRVVLPVVLAVASPTATSVPTPLPTVPPAIPTLVPTVAPATPTPLPTMPPVATVAAPVRLADPVAAVNPFSCVGGCAVAPDPSCAIKGNVNSDGERIYHAPDGRSYSRTDIKPEEGDRWFCTEAEAVAAGFRAPEND